MNVLSLFSGAGGLDIAACSTGKIKRIVSTDANATFLETTKINLPQHFPEVGHASIVSDARILKGAELINLLGGDVNIVMGGPPCDDFTSSGLRRGVQGLKGGLLYEFLRIVYETRPECFIFENVPNLARQFKLEYEGFLAELSCLGYSVMWELLKACDFGSPTIRQRVFAVGWNTTRVSLGYEMPKPTHGDSDKTPSLKLKPYILISDVQHDLPDVDLLGNSPFLNHTGRSHRQATIAHMKTVLPGRSVVQSRRYRAPWNGLCRSLNAGMDNGTKSYIHAIYDREMSVREYARIQGFPDTWFFSGNHHNGIKQVANAVPIPLGKAVIASIIAHLEKESHEN